MNLVAPGTRVYLACRPYDMRRGFDGLSADVATVLRKDPYSGHLFIFRSKRGDYCKRCPDPIELLIAAARGPVHAVART